MKCAVRICVALLLAWPGLAPALDASLPLASGETLVFDRQAATGSKILLWVASERGFSPNEREAARQLAERGIEVWQVDWVNALLLPPLPRSLDHIAPGDMRAITEQARATGKQLFLYATARAAVPVLRGLENQQACVLLMHPNLYARADALADADYLPFTGLNKLNILLLQPMRSAATPWISNQMAALESASAIVRLRKLAQLREGFWRREDATRFESDQGLRLADLLSQWMDETSCN